MCVLLPIVSWSAFPGAYLLGLSDMLECLGGLQMALVWLENHPPSWKSPHNRPESLAIKQATICDV